MGYRIRELRYALDEKASFGVLHQLDLAAMGEFQDQGVLPVNLAAVLKAAESEGMPPGSTDKQLSYTTLPLGQDTLAYCLSCYNKNAHTSLVRIMNRTGTTWHSVDVLSYSKGVLVHPEREIRETKREAPEKPEQ